MKYNDLLIRRQKLLDQLQTLVQTASDENRDLTEDEETEYAEGTAEAKRLLTEAQRLRDLEEQRSIEAARNEPSVDESEATTDTGPLSEERTFAYNAVVTDRAAQQPFSNFGEQLIAIARASTPGEPIDRRLLEMRAPTGLQEGTPSEGGFLVQTDFVAGVWKRMYEVSTLLQRCRNQPISANANSLKMNAVDESSRARGSRMGGVTVDWLAEGGEIGASKPKFRQIELNLKKLAGAMYATDELLSDAAALDGIAREAFAEEFAFEIDEAILRGTGAGQPLGILNSNGLVTQAAEGGQSSTTIVAENVIKMNSRLWARSQANAVWFINQDTLPQLSVMELTVGTGGIALWMPANGLAGQRYSTLYGRPVVPIEQASTLGTVGDILLLDLSQYLIIDKGGMNAATSIHVRFMFDEQVFRVVTRLDGQPVWNTTLTPANGSTTQSPYIALATR